jgi:hypothetical protein
VPSVEPREQVAREILARVEAGEAVSQRVLARDLGIALGLTNLMLRQMARKGWLRLRHVKPNRVRYLITPAGIAAKARLTRSYIRDSILSYRKMRERMRDALAEASGGFNGDLLDRERTPVAFYGAGEAAEVAYMCLQEMPLELTALVDPHRTAPFFGVAVHHPSKLNGDSIGARRFAKLIVMPVENEDEVRGILAERRVPQDQVLWL